MMRTWRSALHLTRSPRVSEANSWQTGVNRHVEGRQVRRVLGYYGGAVEYRRRTGDVARGAYRELRFGGAA